MARQATLQHAKLQAMAMARTKWFHQEEMGGNPNEIQFFYHKAPKGEASQITNTDQCLWTSMLSFWLNVAGFLALTTSPRHQVVISKLPGSWGKISFIRLGHVMFLVCC